MYPTYIGLLLTPVALAILLRGSAPLMLAFLMGCSVMGGAGAIALPALGGSSIPPAYLGLGFLILRLIAPGSSQRKYVVDAVAANIWIVVFAVYAVGTAFLLPRLFAGTMDVAPMRVGKVKYIFETRPLHFTSQNITTSIYILGTALTAVASYLVARYRSAPSMFVNAAFAVALVHAAFGVMSAAFAGTSLMVVINVFRNGGYAQLEQAYGDMARMSGIMPEASAFAGFAFAWFVFHFECWLRGVESRKTGIAAAVLAGVLVMSTSSTAYVCLGAYAALILMRQALYPGSVKVPKLVLFLALAWIGVTLVITAVSLQLPGTQRFFRMVEHMTVDKADSYSGRQRSFWARQGLEAFWHSGGLGIGAGSFRSSSVFTAIAGSLGIIGIVSFCAYVVKVVKPLARSTYAAPRSELEGLGVAAGWAALLGLIPAAVQSPSPDPGMTFAMLAGVAMAFRSQARSALAHQHRFTLRPGPA